ncbi:hypothetical protein [Nocardia abscessus]|uniref:hypothetical protein n=1 Tax=Nocardia abscessus TaxID=120957 RepID=UPI0002FEF89D|nr:hypothetical protein [Nocardia abscessus]MCC3328236.1 hypothetical protein [Nocardia abscessus]
MPPRLSKPTDVPDDYEPLIEMLWRFYIAASEPPMRKVAQVVAGLDDDERTGTANHETIRRTLRATNLPQQQTVEVIFLALCELANVDPDDVDRNYGDRWEPNRTHRQQLRLLYRLARYGTVTDLPRTRDEKARQEAEAEAERARSDPWGSPPASSRNDEPPF